MAEKTNACSEIQALQSAKRNYKDIQNYDYLKFLKISGEGKNVRVKKDSNLYLRM